MIDLSQDAADPRAHGFDPDRLADAVAFAARHGTDWPVDLRSRMEAGYFEHPPFNEILGPVTPRGEPNGLLIRGGRRVAGWGDTRRADMTFSVAKSYLSLLAGIAVGDGLIGDLDEPVGRRVRDGGFDGPHNGRITWRHLLQQTSEWEGTLWGKADAIDRNRTLGAGDNSGRVRSMERELRAPGTFWEYNDVRVNRLSLALLRVFGHPLPEVFRDRIADPIGASRDWRWDGYRDSQVEVGGRTVVSVPGGGHWGGGVVIDAQDQARIGLLLLRDGVWDGRRILPEGWVAASTAPCALNRNYGLLWWLNTDRAQYPAASPESVFALGTGGNITWIDPANDLVAAIRWIDTGATNGFIERVMASCLR